MRVSEGYTGAGNGGGYSSDGATVVVTAVVAEFLVFTVTHILNVW